MASGLILTDVGAAEIEAAYQAGSVVSIPEVIFGDGGGVSVTPDPAVTQLAGYLGEVPLSAGNVGPVLIGGVAVIPCRKYPGKVLREFGLRSSTGTLIAYGAYPDTYLPSQGDSIVKELVIKFIMPLVHAQNVQLVIDPNIAVMTQEEADKRYFLKSLLLKEIEDAGANAQAEARSHLGVYSKEECDNKYQPKGNYALAGDSYTKIESDNKYQLKGNYSLKGDSYTKAESDNKYQPKGNYALTGDSYTKGESDAIYVRGGRLGAEIALDRTHYVDLGADRTIRALPGCVVTGMLDASIYSITFNNIDVLYIRPIQDLIGSNWVTVGQA